MNIDELENLLTVAKKLGRVNPREKHLWKEASLTFLGEKFNGEHCSKCWINLIKKLTNFLTKYKKDEEIKKIDVSDRNVEKFENTETQTTTETDELIETVENEVVEEEKPKKKKKKSE